MSHEERITELESRVAFQEDALDKMSDEMAHQEKQIEMLTQMVKILNRNLESLRGDPLSSSEDEPPPPHY
ncbi:SlyX family protein [Pontibacterium sp.]|uniref:SlyX family protein n=1 Tax=Pontibacterium sp. TaxID=2036026 RepID=UPI00351284CB